MLSPSNPNLTPTQVANCLYALEEFAKVPPEEVVPDLKTWVCGTAACFGGWVARQPYFQAQGVISMQGMLQGMPCIPSGIIGVYDEAGEEVANHLFGDYSLFYPVSSAEVSSEVQRKKWRDEGHYTNGAGAKEVVLTRLRQVLWPAQGE